MPARTWRDADLRGGHGPPPASVSSVVRHAHLALAISRWGESVLFFAAGTCITLAAASLSEVPLDRWDAWTVALLGGLCAGAGWGIAHFERPLGVARELDHRLRHQGGLITAFELEREGDRTPMAVLVIRRVLARLRAREAVRVMFPPLALPVAAPLIGAAILAFAVERARPEVSEGLDLEGMTEGMVGAVSTAYTDALNADEDGSLDGRTAREVMGAVNEIKSLERMSQSLQDRPAEARERLDSLDERLAALQPRLAEHPELQAQLGEARNWLDAARMDLPPAQAGASPPAGGDSAPEGGQALTARGEDGTMSGSTTGAEGSSTPSAPNPGDPDRTAREGGAEVPGPAPVDVGTTAESWWPPEYDGIVAGWIELRRREP